MIKKEHYIYDLVEECKILLENHDSESMDNILHDVEMRIDRHEIEEDMIYLTLIGLKEYIKDEIKSIDTLHTLPVEDFNK
jgi:hypothetical protein